MKDRRARKTTHFTFPRFDTRMNISMLFQSGGGLKTFSTIVTRIQPILTFTGFTRVRCVARRWPVEHHHHQFTSIVHSKKRQMKKIFERLFSRFSFNVSSSRSQMRRSEVVERRTFLKLKFDWLNMNREGKKNGKWRRKDTQTRFSSLLFSLCSHCLY